MNLPPCRLMTIAAIASLCANWSFAFQITYINTSVDTFYELAKTAYRKSTGCLYCTLPESDWLTEWSTVVSSFYPGTIAGFLVVPVLTSWIGVKKAQMAMCLAAIFGVLVHFLALHMVSYGMAIFATSLSIGRFLIGIQAGSSLCLLPLYIIEISPPKYRTILNSFQQVSQSFSTLLGLLLGSEEIFPFGGARYVILQFLAMFPVLILFIMLLFTPSTPTYLLKSYPRRSTKLHESEKYYFGEDIDSRLLLNDNMISNFHGFGRRKSITQYVEAKPTSWRSSTKGFLIGAVVAVSYAFTGDDLIDTFSSQMLVSVQNVSSISHQETDTFARLISDALGVVLFVASIFGIYLADRYGRRNLVLIGLAGTAVANVGASLLASNKVLVSLCFAATKTFIGIGCGGPAWFLTSELVQPEHAWIFQPASTGLLLASTMLETFFYLYVDALVGNFSLLILAAVPAFVAAVGIYLFLPETKGKSTEEIQEKMRAKLFCGLDSDSKFEFANGYGTFDGNIY